MRWRTIIGLGLALVSFTWLGCDFEKLAKDLADSSKKRSTPPASTPAGRLGNVGKSDETIAVGTFNIQVLGQSKLDEPKVMEILAKIVRRFDVIAIQELRSKEQDVIPRFVERINEDGSQFDYIVGPRLGRTISKEQYVYLYDARRIEVRPGSVYTASDEGDHLHREPLVATFQVKSSLASNPFTFTLINIHTDPDETDWELDALDDVFVRVQNDRIREDDVIMLGDLNVDETEMGELSELPGVMWVISGKPTNTRKTETYDNIVFDRRRTVEFTGRAGVLDIEEEYQLTRDEALDVSDHLPVWAAFYAREDQQSGPLASRPANRR